MNLSRLIISTNPSRRPISQLSTQRTDPIHCVFKAWYWPCGWMFKCLGWPSPATFIILFSKHRLWRWSSCAPKHVMWQRVFWVVSEFEVRSLIQWTGHFAIYVRWLLGWRYMCSLHSADEIQEGRNSCPLLRSCFIGSCHVSFSKRFSRSIILAVYCHGTKAGRP